MILSSAYLRRYGLATAVSVIVAAVAIGYGGPSVLLPITALVAIEITFSFDNAVLNSQVLTGMSLFWRRMFLTLGIAIAVFGVRAFLPLLMVSWASGNSLSVVFDQALHHPEVYSRELKESYPVIAAFGGIFLLMVGLMFFGERKKVMWLKRVEEPIARVNKPWLLSVMGTVVAGILIVTVLAPGDQRITVALFAGALVFLVVKWLTIFLLSQSQGAVRNGLILFIYLELLDASFSFDGVVAAFAITKDIFLIIAGLGIGALFLRSMTVHLLEKNTLGNYRYLIHGAHYAILCLAGLMLAGIRFEIPEAITGVLGLAIILASFQDSRLYNRKHLVG